jgi:hypothetical protein
MLINEFNIYGIYGIELLNRKLNNEKISGNLKKIQNFLSEKYNSGKNINRFL